MWFLLLSDVVLTVLDFSVHNLNALILLCFSNVHNLLVYFFYQALNRRVRKEHEEKFLNYLFGSLQSSLLPRHADLREDTSTHILLSRKKENI